MISCYYPSKNPRHQIWHDKWQVRFFLFIEPLRMNASALHRRHFKATLSSLQGSSSTLERHVNSSKLAAKTNLKNRPPKIVIWILVPVFYPTERFTNEYSIQLSIFTSCTYLSYLYHRVEKNFNQTVKDVRRFVFFLLMTFFAKIV